MPQGHREGFQKREFGKDKYEGIAMCKICHAVHKEKRWFYNEAEYKILTRNKSIPQVTCPGCQMIKDKHIDGLVNIKSYLVKERKTEIINLIHNAEESEKQKNPLSRIIFMDTRGSAIEIQTTTQFLAKKIGQAVDKAYSGKLQIQKLPREKFIRVNWTRE